MCVEVKKATEMVRSNVMNGSLCREKWIDLHPSAACKANGQVGGGERGREREEALRWEVFWMHCRTLEVVP